MPRDSNFTPAPNWLNRSLIIVVMKNANRKGLFLPTTPAPRRPIARDVPANFLRAIAEDAACVVFHSRESFVPPTEQEILGTYQTSVFDTVKSHRILTRLSGSV
jgi:hypothetical protein